MTTLLVLLLIGFIVCIFVANRTMGIYKLNEQIINLVVDYDKRHPGGKGLPPAEKLFVPLNQKIWSFKKLTIENWVDEESLKILKS